MGTGIFENNIDSNVSSTSYHSTIDHQPWTNNSSGGIDSQKELPYKRFSPLPRYASAHNLTTSLNYPNYQMLYNPYFYSNHSFFQNLQKYFQFKNYSRPKDSYTFYAQSPNDKNNHEKGDSLLDTNVIMIDDDLMNDSVNSNVSVESYLKLPMLKNIGYVLSKEVNRHDNSNVRDTPFDEAIDKEFPLDLSFKKCHEKEFKVENETPLEQETGTEYQKFLKDIFPNQEFKPISEEIMKKITNSSANHVKRPMNAFMIWAQNERKKILNAYPEVHNSDISKLLGLKWNKMSDDEKQPYFKKQVELNKLHMEKYPGYRYKPRQNRVYIVKGRKVGITEYKKLVKERKKAKIQNTEKITDINDTK